VRELENEVLRWLALYPEETVLLCKQLSEEIHRRDDVLIDAADLGTLRHLDRAGELLERYLIRKAIAATGGRKAAAARRLGLSRQGLYKKLQRYGMKDLIGPPTRGECASARRPDGATAVG
jgi:DNA-binding NtrC family response regulator